MSIFQTSIFKPRFKRDGSDPADMVVLSARIITCDPGNPRAEALAVRGERIAYVGDNSGAREYIGPDTRVINARRRTLFPGFIDNHAHVLWIGALQALMTKKLFECNSVDEVKSVMTEYSSENPDLPFLLGLGWRYDYIPGGLPDRELLDSFLDDRPAILWSYCGMSGWLNTMAFELMRERNPLAFERLGPYIDDNTGDPTGLLRDFHHFNPYDFFTAEELGADLEEKMMENVREVLDEAVSVGVTTISDIQIYRPFIPFILSFRERGGLDKVRIRCSYYVGPHVLDDEAAFGEDMTWWKELGEKESDAHLILGDSLKFYIDGVHGSYTAFTFEPYPDRPGDHGVPIWTQEQFDRVMEIVDGMGLQACTHCCGDAGIRRVIDSCEHAQKVNGQRDSRHRAEHCSTPALLDVERMGRIGVHASMQPAHFFAIDRFIEELLGPQRIREVMPWKSMENAGVSLSFGSDWCNSPLNPVYGLLLAATRLNYRQETDWGPGERIGLEDAVRHWTLDCAKALFMENDIGSIEVGKYADFAIFTENLLKLDSPWFLLTHELELGRLDGFVDLTVVGGKIVYQKEKTRR